MYIVIERWKKRPKNNLVSVWMDSIQHVYIKSPQKSLGHMTKWKSRILFESDRCPGQFVYILYSKCFLYKNKIIYSVIPKIHRRIGAYIISRVLHFEKVFCMLRVPAGFNNQTLGINTLNVLPSGLHWFINLAKTFIFW